MKERRDKSEREMSQKEKINIHPKKEKDENVTK